HVLDPKVTPAGDPAQGFGSAHDIENVGYCRCSPDRDIRWTMVANSLSMGCACATRSQVVVVNLPSAFSRATSCLARLLKGGDHGPSNVRLRCKLFQTMRGNLDDCAFREAIITAANHMKSFSGGS